MVHSSREKNYILMFPVMTPHLQSIVQFVRTSHYHWYIHLGESNTKAKCPRTQGKVGGRGAPHKRSKSTAKQQQRQAMKQLARMPLIGLLLLLSDAHDPTSRPDSCKMPNILSHGRAQQYRDKLSWRHPTLPFR